MKMEDPEAKTQKERNKILWVPMSKNDVPILSESLTKIVRMLSMQQQRSCEETIARK